MFERAISQAPSTLPAHRALFQSRWASRTVPDAPVLAELLAAAGYRTAAFTGGGNVSARFGFGRGFEIYEEDRGGLSVSLPRAFDWLAAVEGAPFLLFLHTYDVHLPYDPPAPFDTWFGEAYEGPVDGPASREILRRQRGLGGADAEDAPPLAPADRERLVALYDGGIRYVDEQVGRLLEGLDALGLTARTTLVLYSDHGEEFLDHGSWIHSHTVFDELVRVPLIWRGPGVAPRRIDAQVRLIDVAPTLLELAEVPAPAGFAGRSLRPLLAGEPDAPRPAVSEMGRLASFSDWPWKLIRGGPAARLFDLSRDPAERRDLGPQEPERAAELEAALAGALGSPDAVRRVEAVEGGGEALDPELRERLRELGYLDDASSAESSR